MSFKPLCSRVLNFRSRQLTKSCCDSPFVPKRVSDTSESFTPKHVGRLHKNLRTLTLHFLYQRVTIINVHVNSNSRPSQGSWARSASVFRKFFAHKEAESGKTKLAVHDPTVRHLQ